MATVKRAPYHRVSSGGLAIRGEVNTAGAGDARPAVLILYGAERTESSSLRLLERVARAGLTAISVELVPDWALEALEEAADAVSEFAAVLLAGRHPGLAPPVALGIFGEKRHALLAIAVAAREPRVTRLVTWSPEVWESVEKTVGGALSAGVAARWLELRSGIETAPPRRSGQKVGGAAEVRRVPRESEMIDAAVAWFSAMLS